MIAGAGQGVIIALGQGHLTGGGDLPLSGAPGVLVALQGAAAVFQSVAIACQTTTRWLTLASVTPVEFSAW